MQQKRAINSKSYNQENTLLRSIEPSKKFQIKHLETQSFFGLLALLSPLFFLLLISSSVFAATALISWDKNPEPDISHYMIFYGTSSSNYTDTINNIPADQTSYEINGLEEGQTYFFSVKAVDMAGQMSDYSDETTGTVPGGAGDEPGDLSKDWYLDEEWLEAGTVSVNHKWQAVSLEREFENPVVIVSPPSLNGGHPCVVRIRNVTSSSFEIAIQEWDYLDVWHTMESVHYLVVEAGTHILPNGTIWQADTFEVSGTLNWQAQAFDTPFEKPPLLFTTIQGFGGDNTVAIRLKGIDEEGFFATLQEEELLKGDGHIMETIGYLAVEQPGEEEDYAFFLSCNHRLKEIKEGLELKIKIEEEKSKDRETWHTDEQTGILILGDKTFAQIESFKGPDTAALRFK